MTSCGVVAQCCGSGFLSFGCQAVLAVRVLGVVSAFGISDVTSAVLRHNTYPIDLCHAVCVTPVLE